jgi:hypothetical protein
MGHIKNDEDDTWTAAEKMVWLLSRGFIIGKRDPRLNQAHKGKYMVAEDYKLGTHTEVGHDGVWCIVGDDLDKLIIEAYDTFADGTD